MKISYFTSICSGVPFGLRSYVDLLQESGGRESTFLLNQGTSKAKYVASAILPYEDGEGKKWAIPCQVKYHIDETTGLPHTAFIVTPFGKARINLVNNKKGIPLPVRISFSAYDYISEDVNYRNPLKVRANVKSDENIEPAEVDSDNLNYDPERAFLGQDAYDPGVSFCQNDHSEFASDDTNDDDQRYSYEENPAPESSDSGLSGDHEGNFFDLQRFYLTSRKSSVITLVNNGKDVFVPSEDECLYVRDSQNGRWISATPSNSEVDPRASHEKWLLNFHLYAFAIISSESIPRLLQLNK